MRTYITPVKLNQWSPDIPDTCIKCLEERGTLFHCVLDCPKLKQYWKIILQTISDIVKVPYEAKVCILGIYPQNFIINSKQATLIDFGLLQARRMIALYWRKLDIPLVHVWVKEMASCIVMEKLTYRTRGKSRRI